MRRTAPERATPPLPRPRRAGWLTALGLSAAFHGGLAWAALLLSDAPAPLPEPAGIVVGIVVEPAASGGERGAEAGPDASGAAPSPLPTRDSEAEAPPALPLPLAAAEPAVAPPPATREEKAGEEPSSVSAARPADPVPATEALPPAAPTVVEPVTGPARTAAAASFRQPPPPAPRPPRTVPPTVGQMPDSADAPAASPRTAEPLAPAPAAAGARDGDGDGRARQAARPGQHRHAGAGTGTAAPVALAGNPPPRYPPRARRRGLEGTVLLRVTVAADGTASEVVVARSSGHALLDREARSTVSRWRFATAGPDGGTLEIPVAFRLVE